jgi:hypothetical protein
MLRVSFVTVSPQSYRESTCLHSFHKIKEEPPRRPLLILDTRSLLKGNPMNENGGIRLVTFPHGVQHSQDNPVGARHTTWPTHILIEKKKNQPILSGRCAGQTIRVTCHSRQPLKGASAGPLYKRSQANEVEDKSHQREKGNRESSVRE